MQVIMMERERESPSELGSRIAFQFPESVVLSETWWHCLPLNFTNGSPLILILYDNALFTDVHSAGFVHPSQS